MLEPKNASWTIATARPRPKIYIVHSRHGPSALSQSLADHHNMELVLERSIGHAVDHWYAERPDVAIIDLPAAEKRLALCKKLREVSVGPILVVLPMQDEGAILDAYEAGVDDCIVEPVNPTVFAARVMAWARRSWTFPVENVQCLQTNHWTLDPVRHELIRADGAAVLLTNLEMRLLHILMTEPGHIYSYEQLVRSIWRNRLPSTNKALRKVIDRLRKKMNSSGRNAKPLQTWRGGYAFVDP